MDHRPLVSLLLLGCGASSALAPSAASDLAPARAAALAPERLAAALVERFDTAYCEGDLCLDPFPLWEVTGLAVSGERVALAGPGALLSVWDGSWRTLVAQDAAAADPSAVAVHAVTFAPDGALFAVGAEGRIWSLEERGLALVMQLEDGPNTPSPGRTLVDAIAPAPGELWVLAAEGALHRLRGAQATSAAFPGPFDRLLTTGEAPERSVALSGPFGGYLVREPFASAPALEPFVTDAQLDTLGEYSGCGAAMFDARAEAVLARIGELIDDAGLPPEQARARAEQEVPPRTERLPPPGLSIPSSEGTLPELHAALSASEDGRNLLPFVTSPPVGHTTARVGEAVVLAGADRAGHLAVWARFAGGSGVVTGPEAGDARAVAVRGERALVIGTSGLAYLARPDGAHGLAGSEVLRDPRLARTTAALLVDETHALVATEAPALHTLDLAAGTLGPAQASPGVLRTLAAADGAVVGVGDEGLAVRLEAGAMTPIATGATTDLGCVLAREDGGFFAGGAAGTLLEVVGGVARAFPRVTTQPVVELVASGAVLFGRLQRGALLRAEGSTVSVRPSTSGPSAGLSLRFHPDPSAAGRAAALVEVAIDAPGAVAPWGALRDRFAPSGEDFGDRTLAAPFRDGGRRSAVFDLERSEFGGSTCCDVGWEPSAAETLLAAVNGGSERSTLEALAAFDLTERLVSLARRSSVGVTGSGCEVRVTARSLTTGQVVSERTFGCAEGTAARDEALFAHLASLELDAAWEPAAGADGLSETATRLGGFFAREVQGRVEIVAVDASNRVATVLLQLPRGAPGLGERRVPVSWRLPTRPTGDGYDETEVAYSQFLGEGVFWVGATPATLLGERRAGDDTDCADVLVDDPDGETTLRTGPSSRSAAVAQLPNATLAHVARREGRWLAIDAPERGWLYADNVACAE